MLTKTAFKILEPKRFSVFVLLVFCLLATLNVHQYSISLWEKHFPEGTLVIKEVGTAREFRSDDYFAELPYMFSQRHTTQPFSTQNELIGLGEPTAFNPTRMPVLHYSTFFRPTYWGYFLGDDFGMAWNWWSIALGIFLSTYLVMLSLAPAQYILAFTGALFVYFSPFLQLWSFHYLEILAYANLVLLSARSVLDFKKPIRIFAVAGLAYSAGSIALNLYPPFQVPLAWIVTALVAATLLDGLKTFGFIKMKKHLAALCGGVLVALGIVAFYFWQNREILTVLRNTVYPGTRFVTGGALEWWRLFSDTFFLHTFVDDWRVFWNICEQSTFVLFFLPLIFAAFFEMGQSFIAERTRQTIDLQSVALLFCCIILVIFMCVGFPEFLARISLMSQVTETRIPLSFGYAITLLYVRVSYILTRRSTETFSFLSIGLSSLLWMIILVLVILAYTKVFPEYRAQFRFALLPAVASLGLMYLSKSSRPAAVAVTLFVTASSVINYNPVVRGGYDKISSTELSQQIVANNSPDSRWLVYGETALINLPRMLGVKCLNGTHSIPQLELWSRFDSSGTSIKEYNRFAHVSALPTSDVSEVQFKSPFPNMLIWSVHPSHPVLKEMNVDRFLVVGDEHRKLFETLREFNAVYERSPFYIYARVK